MENILLDDLTLNKKLVGLTDAQIAFVQESTGKSENYYIITATAEDKSFVVATFWHHFSSPWYEAREHSLPESRISSKNNIKIAPLLMPLELAESLLKSYVVLLQNDEAKLKK